MDTFPIYLFILLIFANRYILGLYLSLVRGRRFDQKIEGYEPTVTVVMPLYNEGKSIYNTILSIARLDYPKEKLTVTVVDDCSTDDSYEWACKAAREHPNVTILRNPYNMGKRKGINHAVRMARSEIIVSIDSDVTVFPTALRELVARFTGPEVAAVGGRVHVSNPNVNWLTKLQTIKYYFGQEHLKNLERSLRSVMCLSGCLTAYRRHVLMQLEPILENRNLLGIPIKYGEDRFLTRQIVKAGYRTVQTTQAMCFTKAMVNMRAYFNQQLRWKRSNIVDFIGGIGHAWNLHPLLCMHYLSMFLLLLVYPFVILFNIIEGDFFFLAMAHIVVGDFRPDLVITHSENDILWDHGLVNHATVSALRRTPCDLLAYSRAPRTTRRPAASVRASPTSPVSSTRRSPPSRATVPSSAGSMPSPAAIWLARWDASAALPMPRATRSSGSGSSHDREPGEGSGAQPRPVSGRLLLLRCVVLAGEVHRRERRPAIGLMAKRWVRRVR